MKKIFMIIACAGLVLACGGNAVKHDECKGHKAECAAEQRHGDCGDCGSGQMHDNCSDCTGEHSHGECGGCEGGHGYKCNR